MKWLAPYRRDSLTGVGDRRAGERRVRRLRVGDAVVMLDVDRFKSVNDSDGHLVGDRVLRGFAASVAAAVRSSDHVARWGGDEFVVVLRGAGDAAGAIARRLHRSLVDTTPLPGLTCSAGVAVHTGGDPMATLATADAALLDAKRAGRARLVTA